MSTKSRVALAAVLCLLLAGLAAVVWWQSRDDEELNDAERAVAEAPPVSQASFELGGCTYEEDRGGFVVDGAVESRTSGLLKLTLYVQRRADDGDPEILPGYVVTALVFDEDTRSRPVDVVIPVTPAEHEAGYDECQWSMGGS